MFLEEFWEHVPPFQVAKAMKRTCLADLLHNPVFTGDNLAGLSSSKFPEVRWAAVANLSNEPLLVKIVVKGRNNDVREPL